MTWFTKKVKMDINKVHTKHYADLADFYTCEPIIIPTHPRVNEVLRSSENFWTDIKKNVLSLEVLLLS